MKKRNCRFEVRFTNAAFIRRAVCGAEVREAPPADVPALIQEVRRVGNNLNQIMKRANALGLLDVPQLRKALEDNRTVEKLIVDTYTTPSE